MTLPLATGARLERKQSIRLKPRIPLHEIQESFNQKRRAAEQHEAERDLCHDEAIANVIASRGVAPAACPQ